MSSNNIVPSSGVSSSSSTSSGGLTLAQANAIFISRSGLTTALPTILSQLTGMINLNTDLVVKPSLKVLSANGVSNFFNVTNAGVTRTWFNTLDDGGGNATFVGNVNLATTKSIVPQSANGVYFLGSTGGLQFKGSASTLSPFTIQSSLGVNLFSLLNGYTGSTPMLQINDGNNNNILMIRSDPAFDITMQLGGGKFDVVIQKPDNYCSTTSNILNLSSYSISGTPMPGLLTLYSNNNAGNTSLISNGGSATFALPISDAAFPGMPMISDGAGNLSLNYPGIIATGTLSMSVITTLYTQPKLLISAPGTGKAIIVDTFFMHFVYPSTNGVPYTNGSDLYLTYSNSSVNNFASSTTINAQNLKNTSDAYAGTLGSFASGFSSFNGMTPINKAVYIRTNSPNFTTTADGITTFSGTINYQIRYHIEDLSTL